MASSSGKVIVCGEHAVVYGVAAIAGGIARGAHAQATPSEHSVLRLGDRVVRPSDDSELGRAFRQLAGALPTPPCDVTVTLKLPAGAGLGASAAIGVAVARALLDAGPPVEPRDRDALVERAALAWESVFHGNPSGIDTAAAARGGCIYFRRGQPPVSVAVPTPLVFAIGLAGPPAPTREMVESVARLKERKPELVQKALDGIAALVENARLCIEAGDHVGLGKLLDLNQMLLAGLHVSSEDIELACAVARDAGALGAKLTGAGGGGAVIALCSGDAAPVLAAWGARGISGFPARVSGEEPAA
ncbi:MAG: mevalonate kinase [Polyangiaceae bacterium]|nr:mevalonate kinase [Polyangiaceae bacterium]